MEASTGLNLSTADLTKRRGTGSSGCWAWEGEAGAGRPKAREGREERNTKERGRKEGNEVDDIIINHGPAQEDRLRHVRALSRQPHMWSGHGD